MTDGLRIAVASAAPQISGERVATLQECGADSVRSGSVLKAMNTVATESAGVVFCAADVEDGGYRDRIGGLKLAKVRLPVVVVPRLGEWKEYLEAIRPGAFDWIAPPCRRDEIEPMIGTAPEQREGQAVAVSAGERYPFLL